MDIEKMGNKIRYYRHLFNIYRGYKNKKISPPAPPLRLWIELSSKCNLTCTMCPNKDLDESQKGFMSKETFTKIVDEASDFAHEATLHHRGESLFHPQVNQLITYAGDRIPVTKLHTNGTLLTPTLIDQIVNSPLSRISFSIDGFNKNQYETIRQGAKFEDTLLNIKSLLIKKIEQGNRTLKVAVELIKSADEDKNNRDKFVEEIKGLGVEEILFKNPHNWAGAIPLNFKRNHYSPCTFLWNAMIVLWNGDISICTQDFFAKNIIGNVNHNSLLKIWQNPQIQKIREKLINKQFEQLSPCKDCDRLWRKTFMGIPTEFLTKVLRAKMP